MPVIAMKLSSRGRVGGAASNRVIAMNIAEVKNDAELTTNAASRPNTAVTTPPIDAPIASIADHVALASAFAGTSWSAVVPFGIVAVRAGSKNAVAATAAPVTTYAIQM